MKGRPRLGVDRVCKACGCIFYKSPSMPDECCGMACRNAAKTKIPLQPCENCGVQFRALTFGRRMRYCSRACFRSHWRGRNNPHWLGNRRHERGITFKANAMIVRERDCKCLGCDKPQSELPEKLSVDHVVPFRLAKYAEGVDPNDVRNLVSLCRRCHVRKTRRERHLLRGDLFAFRMTVSSIIPIHMIDQALDLFDITTMIYLHQNGGSEKIIPAKGTPCDS